MGNSNSRLGQCFGKAQLRVPGATSAESKDFSERFATLPAEIQVMIIAETVTDPNDVPITHLIKPKKTDCALFKRNETFYSKACKQYRRLNTFRYQLGAPLDKALGQSIRRLTLNYSIVVTGGDIADLKTFRMFHQEASNFHYLPHVFPQLEDLLVQVDNTGKVAPGAVYLCPGPVRSQKDPQMMALDRMWKIAAVVCSLRTLTGKFRPLRQSATLRMKVIFVQVDNQSSRHINEIASTALMRIDERGSYIDWKGFYQLMDYPRSAVWLAGISNAVGRE